MYWQQVANQFSHPESGTFGPQTTVMLYNSANLGDEGEAGYYVPTLFSPWKDRMVVYDANKSGIYWFIRTIHHENAHRQSKQLPPEQGGFGPNLAWAGAADSDSDAINDMWEKDGGAGVSLGFDVLPANRVQNMKWRGNWDHGWIDPEQVKNPPGDPYTNANGYDPGTGSGLCVRNQNHVDEKREELKEQDWSSHIP